MNKNNGFVFFFYLMSFPLFLCSSNWFLLWVMIELNTMNFLILMKPNTKKKFLINTLTYFIMQSLSSLVIFISMMNMVMENSNYSQPSSTLLVALFMKLAMIPLHAWMVFILMKSENMILWLVIGPQKIMPFFLLLWTKPFESFPMFLIIMLTAMASPFMGFSQTNLSMIMTYSSITNGSWLLSTILMSNFLWEVYFLFYMMTSLYICIKMKKWVMQFTTMKQNKSFSLAMFFFNLSGLPPLPIFFLKLMIMSSFLQQKMYLMSIFLMMMTLLDLFIYMQPSFFMFLLKKSKN